MSQRPEYLDSLEADLNVYRPAIQEAAQTIIDDEISQYPIFIMYKQEFPFGEKILDADELDRQWSVNAATAEELIKAGLIPLDKARFFITNYKPAATYMCLFVVPSPQEANFIFVPY